MVELARRSSVPPRGLDSAVDPAMRGGVDPSRLGPRSPRPAGTPGRPARQRQRDPDRPHPKPDARPPSCALARSPRARPSPRRTRPADTSAEQDASGRARPPSAREREVLTAARGGGHRPPDREAARALAGHGPDPRAEREGEARGAHACPGRSARPRARPDPPLARVRLSPLVDRLRGGENREHGTRPTNPRSRGSGAGAAASRLASSDRREAPS